MRPLAKETIADRIERLEALDPASKALQRAVRRLVPQESRLKDLLSGTWLGHPLHPLLTDVVVGAWTSAFFLDLVPREDARRAADRLIGIGVVSAAPTALAGLSDWAELSGRPRRVGSVHAMGNSTALALYTAAWLVRRRGRRKAGIALAMTGSGVASFSAWLGGHLSFATGVGVNQTVFDAWPTEWTPAVSEAELEEGAPTAASAAGVDLVLVRRGSEIHVLLDRCSHRGCALHRGRLEDGRLTCACHGSTFELDGRLVKGPATSPQPAFAARVRDGTVEVRGPERFY